MFFALMIVLLVLFHEKSAHLPLNQLWFQFSLMVGAAYIGGFFDSRIFRRLDKNNANLLAEAELRYEQNIEHLPIAQTQD